MSTYCQHHKKKSDENLLLDDENAIMEKCDCPENVNNHETILNENGTVITTFSNGNGVASKRIIMDDQIDNLEDSPLLINDCYANAENEYHCHDIISELDDSTAWKKLVAASILCFLFMITELVGGFLAGSLAVMTDAAHLFSDFIGFLISLLSIWISRKSATKNMTFGYYRAEVIGAFLSVLTVWLLAVIFASLAINRLLKKEYEIDANTMIIVASVGLLVNIIMGGVLHGVCHTHSHHSMQQNASANSNINVRAAAAHVLGDILQSLGVLIAAIIIKISPDAKLADPICTLIFSIIVICTTAKVVRDSIWVLLEGSPRNTSDIYFELKNITNVKHIHNLHVWSLSPGRNAVSAHLCVDKFCDRDVVLETATCILKRKLNIISCTLQVESYNSDIVNSCKHCQGFQC